VGDWQIVPAESELAFETHILFGLIPVRGRYSEYAGALHVDPSGTASGELKVEAKTVRTGIKKRDRHLRSGDFFAVDDHPHLRFELATLETSPGGSSLMTGTLHIRGHALAIKSPVSLEQVRPDSLRINADFPVDHRSSGLRDVGSGWKKVPETLRVHAALTLARTDGPRAE
jgi:polyisoprenoid-binding protein YceI